MGYRRQGSKARRGSARTGVIAVLALIVILGASCHDGPALKDAAEAAAPALGRSSDDIVVVVHDTHAPSSFDMPRFLNDLPRHPVPKPALVSATTVAKRVLQQEYVDDPDANQLIAGVICQTLGDMIQSDDSPSEGDVAQTIADHYVNKLRPASLNYQDTADGIIQQINDGSTLSTPRQAALLLKIVWCKG